MNHKLDYACEKFGSAAETLSCSYGTLRSRVLTAYEGFNPVGLGGLDGLPEQAVAAYRQLHARLTWMGNEGGTERALAALSDVEVERLARLIVDTSAELYAARDLAERNASTAGGER
jgi:hypothetical protein